VYGFASYSVRFNGDKTLPAYMSNDIVAYFNNNASDSWTKIFWLRGYMEQIDLDRYKEWIGLHILINKLQKFTD
jgi:hypothetical protein